MEPALDASAKQVPAVWDHVETSLKPCQGHASIPWQGMADLDSCAKLIPLFEPPRNFCDAEPRRNKPGVHDWARPYPHASVHSVKVEAGSRALGTGVASESS
jgi:hypothetical protein